MNFVFIVLDTQRGDRLGCQGYWREDVSPNIDRIAAEGVRFPDFYASAIPTGPGFSSLHSGLMPIHHRFYLTPWDEPNRISFDDDIPVAAEIFRDADFTTCAADNLINFRTHMKQFVRGYRYYLNSTPPRTMHAWLTADDTNSVALPWIEHFAPKAEPFFMFIHYWDPHTPYNHPEEWRNYYSHTQGSTEGLHTVSTGAGYDYVPGWGAAHQINEGRAYGAKKGLALGHDLYDEEIRYVDDAVGKVYDALEKAGVLDDTCIVITSDHGEELGQHDDNWGHKYLYESTVSLPLIIRCPKALPQGKVVEGVAQQVDVLPTMLDLAGVDTSELRMDGHSLVPQINGEAPGRPYVFIEGGNNWLYDRALLEDGWKLIKHYWKDEVELYNVVDDPAEIYDLSKKEAARCEAMEKRLVDIVIEQLDGAADPIPRAGAPFTWPLQNFMQVSQGHGRSKDGR